MGCSVHNVRAERRQRLQADPWLGRGWRRRLDGAWVRPHLSGVKVPGGSSDGQLSHAVDVVAVSCQSNGQPGEVP